MEKQTILLVIVLICSTLLLTATPNLIDFQGRLTDSNGNALNTNVSIAFTIYDTETNRTSLWTETQSVDVIEGLFQVTLGENTTLPANLFDSSDRWIGINVAGDGEMTPRTKLTSVPFAITDGDWTKDGNDIYHETGNVGIGTSVPSYKLHLEGSDYDPLLFVNKTGSGRGVKVNTTSACAIWVENSGNHGLRVTQANGDGVHITNANGDGIEVQSAGGFAGKFNGDGYFSGNLGIGTTSPSSELHIQKTVDATLILEADFYNTSYSEDYNPRFELVQDGGIVRGALGMIGEDNSYYAGSYGNSLYLINEYNSKIHFGTNNVINTTIDESGNMDVSGNITAAAFTGDGSGLTNLPNSGWTVDGDNVYKTTGTVGLGISDTGNARFLSRNPYPLYGPGNSCIEGYRYGTNVEDQGGTGWEKDNIDCAIKGHTYFGNNYTAGVAGYSSLYYNNSAAIIGKDFDGPTKAFLAYRDTSGTFWAGYFDGKSKFNGETQFEDRTYVNSSCVIGTDYGGLPSTVGKVTRIFTHDTYDDGYIYSYDYNSSQPLDLVLQQPGGNVGIYQADPLERLDVNGGIKVGYTSGTNPGTIRWYGGNLQVYTASGWYTLTNNRDNTNTGNFQIEKFKEDISELKLLIALQQKQIDELKEILKNK